MSINQLPRELLEQILVVAAEINIREGPTYTFGLTTTSLPRSSCQRYVRGRVPPDSLKWDATSSIRMVCWLWHEWATTYCVRDVYISKLSGDEVRFLPGMLRADIDFSVALDSAIALSKIVRTVRARRSAQQDYCLPRLACCAAADYEPLSRFPYARHQS